MKHYKHVTIQLKSIPIRMQAVQLAPQFNNRWTVNTFEILTAAAMFIMVFWDVKSCFLVCGYECFGVTYSLP
jgi:hypothetical protein